MILCRTLECLLIIIVNTHLNCLSASVNAFSIETRAKIELILSFNIDSRIIFIEHRSCFHLRRDMNKLDFCGQKKRICINSASTLYSQDMYLIHVQCQPKI